MEVHVISILIFLFIAIVGSHAALLGSKQGSDEMIVDDAHHVVTSRKLVMEPTARRFRGRPGRLRGKKGFANVTVSIGGVEIRAGKKGEKSVYIGVKPGANPFKYDYKKGNQTPPAQPTGRSLFFLEKDMKLGHQMIMNFTQVTNKATFLSKEKARSLPFSTDKIKEILHEFSLKPGSEQARIIEETIRGCESKGIQGEQKYCATCLEDMIDYAKSILGANVKAISTEDNDGYNKGQRYTIGKVMKASKDDSVMVCHKENYAYAVYYCHKNKGASSHIVSLISEEGRKAKMVVVCHKDTSDWNPEHIAFQALNVKPGSLPICHFLPKDHIAWVRM